MTSPVTDQHRPVALVTGVGRAAAIGAAVAVRLGHDGWDLAVTHWPAYDERMPWGRREDESEQIESLLRDTGAAVVIVTADLSDPDAPRAVFDAVQASLGPPTALVMCHCESVDSTLLDTTVESFDRHFAVNARATWLLVAEFGRRLATTDGRARIVALTSDHTVGNVPYGASKAALDRIVLAAAREFAAQGVTANVLNPGPVDTGWMSPQLREALVAANPRGRVGQPRDVASLVSFLCSPEGEWVNGQLLHSDGGQHA